jgi:VWFA-related protein
MAQPSVEAPAAAPAALLNPSDAPAAAGRDVAYVFDDIHTTFTDLSTATAAAARYPATLRPEDRAAIFVTSGQSGINFTADRQRLQDVLKSLRPHPLTSGPHCPPMSSYIADLILNQNDRGTLSLATEDAVNCTSGGRRRTPAELERAEQVAKATAHEVLNASSAELQSTLGILREVVQRIAALPGSRSIVLVSPGFLTQTVDTPQALAELTDCALRSDIVVNTLDVRSLSTPTPAPNASHPANPVEREPGLTGKRQRNAVMCWRTWPTVLEERSSITTMISTRASGVPPIPRVHLRPRILAPETRRQVPQAESDPERSRKAHRTGTPGLLRLKAGSDPLRTGKNRA